MRLNALNCISASALPPIGCCCWWWGVCGWEFWMPLPMGGGGGGGPPRPGLSGGRGGLPPGLGRPMGEGMDEDLTLPPLRAKGGGGGSGPAHEQKITFIWVKEMHGLGFIFLSAINNVWRHVACFCCVLAYICSVGTKVGHLGVVPPLAVINATPTTGHGVAKKYYLLTFNIKCANCKLNEIN